MATKLIKPIPVKELRNYPLGRPRTSRVSIIDLLGQVLQTDGTQWFRVSKQYKTRDSATAAASNYRKQVRMAELPVIIKVGLTNNRQPALYVRRLTKLEEKQQRLAAA